MLRHFVYLCSLSAFIINIYAFHIPVPNAVRDDRGEGNKNRPFIAYISPNETKTVGENAVFRCSVGNAEGLDVVWVKMTNIQDIDEEIALDISVNDNSVAFGDRYSTTYDPHTSTYSMIIDRVNIFDTGIYRCAIISDIINEVKEEVYLKVKPPKIHHQLQDTQSCKSGAVKRINDDICFCPRQGNDWICYKRTSETKRPKRDTEQICTPGETYFDGCNECSCTPEGKPGICTRGLCLDKDGNIIGGHGRHSGRSTGNTQSKRDTEQICTPGETYSDGCNECTCSPEGKPGGCTRVRCFDKDGNPLGGHGIPIGRSTGDSLTKRDTEQICTPGETYSDGCNECRCSPEGKPGGCTRVRCFDKDGNPLGGHGIPIGRSTGDSLTKRDTEQICTPGETYSDGCNECTCTPEGKPGGCTRGLCLDKDNNIIGGHGIPSQTSTGNAQTKRDTEQICTPGETYFDGCNECTCTPEGKPGGCTRQLCLDKDGNLVGGRGIPSERSTGNSQTKRDTEQICTPGETYSDGCNECTCTSEGKPGRCTRTYCFDADGNPLGGHGIPSGRSTGNSRTKRDTDGVTSVGDGIPTEGSTGSHQTEQDTEETCIIGESYYDGCNTCTCGPEGPTACTYKYCELVVKDEDGNEIRKPVPKKHVRPVERQSDHHQVKRNTEQETCIIGESYFDGCNTCTCVPEGQPRACTSMACEIIETDKDGKEISRKPTPIRHVVPVERESGNHQVKRDTDGNTIVGDGIPRERSTGSHQTEHDTEETCIIGEMYDDGCSACMCGPEGPTSCTYSHCELVEKDEDGNEISRKPFPVKHVRPVERQSDHHQVKRDTDGATSVGDAVPSERSTDSHQTDHDTEETCIIGERYFDGCNTCTCVPEGQPRACTKEKCELVEKDEDGNEIRKPFPVKHVRPVERQSDHHQVKRDTDGATSVRDGVPSERSTGSHQAEYDTEETCIIGESYYDGCNTCTCVPEGQPKACTYKYCELVEKDEDGNEVRKPFPVKHFRPVERQSDHHQVKRDTDQVCKDGENKISNDRYCVCTSGTWNCIGIEEPCKEGVETSDECGNHCTCTKAGWHCTDMDCVLDDSFGSAISTEGKQIKRSTDPVCEAGANKIENQQYCVCTDGQWSCVSTDEPCTEERESRDQCDNRCWCHPGGMWACTRKGCLTPAMERLVTKRSSDPVCEIGAHKIENDAYCVCSTQRKWVCRDVGEPCFIDGETRDEFGNTCQCKAGGLWECEVPSAAGDLISSSTTDESTKTKRSADDETFSCTPGQTFQKECNSCTCTQDGRNALCTQNDCTQTEEASS